MEQRLTHACTKLHHMQSTLPPFSSLNLSTALWGKQDRCYHPFYWATTLRSQGWGDPPGVKGSVYMGEKQQSWDVNPEPIPDPKCCLLSLTQLTCTQAVRRRLTHLTKTRSGRSQVYHLGGKLPSAMHFKVKFGTEGCRALIPGGLMAMENQLDRKPRVQAQAQASCPISMQQLEGWPTCKPWTWRYWNTVMLHR